MSLVGLSNFSKIMYIYELEVKHEKMLKNIEDIIIKSFSNLDNAYLWDVINVLKNYAVSRHGSRQIYVFLEEVIWKIFDNVRDDTVAIQTLLVIYDQSELCSGKLLDHLRHY